MDLSSTTKLPNNYQEEIAWIVLAFLIATILIIVATNDSPLSIIIQFIGSSLTSILITYVIYKVFAEKRLKERDELLERLMKAEDLTPEVISEKFQEEIEKSTTWIHNGNFGRFVRCNVMRNISSDRAINIKIILLKPTITNCEKLSEFQKSIPFSPHPPEDHEPYSIQAEIITTILISAQINSKFPGLVSIHAREIYKPYRVDIFDGGLFITREGLRDRSAKISTMYESLHSPIKDEAEHDIIQAEKIELPTLTSNYGEKPQEEEIIATIRSVIPESEAIQGLNNLVQKVQTITSKKPRPPYEPKKDN